MKEIIITNIQKWIREERIKIEKYNAIILNPTVSLDAKKNAIDCKLISNVRIASFELVINEFSKY